MHTNLRATTECSNDGNASLQMPEYPLLHVGSCPQEKRTDFRTKKQRLLILEQKKRLSLRQEMPFRSKFSKGPFLSIFYRIRFYKRRLGDIVFRF